MERDSTANRLKILMEERGLKQVDILNLAEPYCEKYNAKITKSDLSQYISGKTKPLQDKLFLLSVALNVSPAWLMGFDVPRERSNSDDVDRFRAFVQVFNETHTPIMLAQQEIDIIMKYRKLDSYGVDLVDTVLEKEFVRCTKPVRKTHVYTYYRRIACAGDGFLFDDIPPESIEAPECQNADFIIGVNGDSMEPTFCDGDLVYVRRTEDIKTGKCGIFTINNECFIKEKGEDCLISHNPKYPNIAGTKDIRCIGEVLGKVTI